jgi:hypothetical protein
MRIGNGGGDGVDCNAVGAEFTGKPHGQGHDAGFGRTVKGIADRFATALGGNRGDIDDAPIALLAHDRNRGLHAIEDTG